jgi:type VI secretion system protein ImpK
MNRVNQATQDCFSALIQLRQLEPDELPPVEALHQRLKSFVDEMMKTAAKAGFSHQDTQDMAYAIVALMDENALTKPEAIRGYWMGNLLQFHYFNENQAGDGFFNRLQAVRADPYRHEVLRVYYLCLLFGFQGRYRIRGGELELMNLIDQVQQDLTRAEKAGSGETLSPHGDRPAETLTRAKRSAPLLMLSLGAVALAVLVYGGLKVALRANVGAAADEIAAWSHK